MNVEAIAERLASVGVLPVVSFDDPEHAPPVARALLRGGVSCIEVTFRTGAAAAAIARLRDVPGLLVGAGTILSHEQLDAARDAGASFALSPGLNASIVEAAGSIGLPFFPGVATASEVDQARSLGLRTVKVFPAAQLGGPAFLSALASVYSEMRFIPTGGVDATTLRSFASAPGVIAVGGSWLTPKPAIVGGDFDEIERLARAARETLA